MKKRIITILACFVMLLFCGLTLAGCGETDNNNNNNNNNNNSQTPDNNEQSVTTQIDATEATTFIATQDTVSAFNNGYEYVTKSANSYGKIQFSKNGNNIQLIYNTYSNAEGTTPLTFMYVTNNKLYVEDYSASQTTPTKIYFNITSSLNNDYYENASNFIENNLMEMFTPQILAMLPNASNLTKSVTGSKTTISFSFEATQQTPVSGTVSLTFENGKLIEYVSTPTSTSTNPNIYVHASSLKVISGNLNFPDPTFAGFTEYVESSDETLSADEAVEFLRTLDLTSNFNAGYRMTSDDRQDDYFLSVEYLSQNGGIAKYNTNGDYNVYVNNNKCYIDVTYRPNKVYYNITPELGEGNNPNYSEYRTVKAYMCNIVETTFLKDDFLYTLVGLMTDVNKTIEGNKITLNCSNPAENFSFVFVFEDNKLVSMIQDDGRTLSTFELITNIELPNFDEYTLAE